MSSSQYLGHVGLVAMLPLPVWGDLECVMDLPGLPRCLRSAVRIQHLVQRFSEILQLSKAKTSTVHVHYLKDQRKNGGKGSLFALQDL